MPLDFALLARDGSPIRIVPLSMQQHDELIAHARELKLYRILRFHDYFEDIDTSPIELPGLSQEVATLARSAMAKEIQGFLQDLQRLIKLALTKGQPLYAIAD